MKNTITSWSITLVISFLKCFKVSARKAIVHFLAKLILKFSSKTKLRSMKNISFAMPHLSQPELERMAISAYQNITYGVVECFWLDELQIEVECDQQTLDLLKKSKGAAIATMHTNCYEVGVMGIEKILGAVTTLSKIPSFLKSADDIYKKANIKVINANEANGFVKLLRSAQKGEVICLHSDHYSKNTKVNFFNKETGAPGGVALLSSYQKLPLFICYAILQGTGKYKVIIETLEESHVENTPEAVALAMQKIYHRFEQIILKYPEQWYWSYKRWRD
jgi:KDO2-lipid IV(A) lauroyltransferase